MNGLGIDLKQYFSKRGHKLTKQRQEVLEVISELSDRFISCREVHERLKEKLHGTGLSTVYRTFSLLVEIELLHKVYMEDGCARYRFGTQTDNQSNIQLICTKCGSITEYNENLSEIIKDKMLKDKEFVMKNTKIKIYGYCRSCLV
ncbi:MAG: hypothetical protein APF77_05750 [Clostridia bacterium BRH_c25]|nr:MAG: hypothetical protein APF77_05750 [Clostridia bacterium BRH_c25]